MKSLTVAALLATSALAGTISMTPSAKVRYVGITVDYACIANGTNIVSFTSTSAFYSGSALKEELPQVSWSAMNSQYTEHWHHYYPVANMTSTLEKRAGTEVITCYGFGTKVKIHCFSWRLFNIINIVPTFRRLSQVDRAPSISVIDDFCKYAALFKHIILISDLTNKSTS